MNIKPVYYATICGVFFLFSTVVNAATVFRVPTQNIRPYYSNNTSLQSVSELIIRPTYIEKNAYSISDLLQSSAALTVTKYGSEGHASVVTLRGNAPNHVKVLLNGVDISTLSGSVDLSTIPSSIVQEIRVYKGVQSARYGSGAIGGVIDIITTTTQQDPRISLGYSSFNTIKAIAALPINTNLWHIDYLYTQGDFKYIDHNGTQFNRDDDIVRTRANNYSRRITTRMTTPKWTADFTALDRGSPGTESIRSDTASQAHYTGGIVLTHSYLTASTRYRWNQFDDPDADFIGAPMKSTQTHWRHHIHHSFLLTGNRWQSLIIPEVSFETMSSETSLLSETYPHRKTASIATQLTLFPFSRWQLSSMARLNYVSRFSTQTAYHVLSHYQLTPHIQFNSSIGTAFRVPTFQELYGQNGLIQPNPLLTEESALEWEIGSRYKKKTTSISLNYYQRYVTNLIRYALLSGFQIKAVNESEVRLRGMELQFDYQTKHFQLSHQLRIENPELKQGNQWKKLLRYGEINHTSTIAYYTQKTTSRFQYQFRRGGRKTHQNTNRYSNRHYLNYQWAYYTNRNISYTIYMNNILDYRYTDFFDYPLPGRHIGITITKEFS